MAKVQKACENCGGKEWEQLTTREGKAGFQGIRLSARGEKMMGGVGVTVDLHVCSGCGNVRIFLAKR